jgi:hypothetical protein
MNRSKKPNASGTLAIENMNRSNGTLAIENMNRSNGTLAIENMNLSKVKLPLPIHSLRNTLKKSVPLNILKRLNNTRKKISPLLLKDKVSEATLPLKSSQNIQTSTNLPGSRNMQTMTLNQNMKAEVASTPVQGKRPSVSKLKDIWRNPAKSNNPYASKQNRETQKREKQARIQAVKNFSTRVAQMAKTKKRKSV